MRYKVVCFLSTTGIHPTPTASFYPIRWVTYFLSILLLYVTHCGYLPAEPLSAVYVVDYGVTEYTDCTIQFQEALDAIPSRGGTIIFPSGVYYITDTLLPKSNTVIKGEGDAILQIVAPGTTDGSPSKLADGIISTFGKTNIRMEGITFDINASANFSTGVKTHSCSHIRIQNCRFINSNAIVADPEWTLHGISARSINYFWVIDNYSDGCQFKLTGADGSITHAVVSRNVIENCTQMGISVVCNVLTADAVIRDITITNNHLYNIDDTGIYVGYDSSSRIPSFFLTLSRISITHNLIHNLGAISSRRVSKGILVRAGNQMNRQITIGHNLIENEEDSPKVGGGVVLEAVPGGGSRYEGLTVIGNQIRRMDAEGIEVITADLPIIAFNHLYDTRGLKVSACIGGVVIGNTSDRGTTGISLENNASRVLVVANQARNHLLEGFRILSEADKDVSGTFIGNMAWDEVGTQMYGYYREGPGRIEDWMIHNDFRGNVVQGLRGANTTTLDSHVGDLLGQPAGTSMQAMTNQRYAQVTWDPPAIATLLFTSLDVTVVGVTPVFMVEGIQVQPMLPADVLIRGQVKADDIVTLTITNLAGVSVDLPMSTVSVIARSYQTD